MNEAILKQQLVIELRRQLVGSVVLRHEDIFRAGIPDTSVTWKKKTFWLEVKYQAPKLLLKEIQDYTCSSLAREGFCFYVVYREISNERMTRIIHPKFLKTGTAVMESPGFNHVAVAEFIKQV